MLSTHISDAPEQCFGGECFERFEDLRLVVLCVGYRLSLIMPLALNP